MNTATITSEALSLPVHERAELAAQLLSSLDALSESEIEPLWFQEAAHGLRKWIKACPNAFLQRKFGGKPMVWPDRPCGAGAAGAGPAAQPDAARISRRRGQDQAGIGRRTGAARNDRAMGRDAEQRKEPL